MLDNLHFAFVIVYIRVCRCMCVCLTEVFVRDFKYNIMTHMTSQSVVVQTKGWMDGWLDIRV